MAGFVTHEILFAGQNDGDIFHDRPKRDSFYLNDKNGATEDEENDVIETTRREPRASSSSSDGEDEHRLMVDSGDTDLPGVLLALSITQRQHSTTEYLPGMVHSNSPTGLLPKFPSWSLLRLSDYSSYNPAHGNLRYRLMTSVHLIAQLNSSSFAILLCMHF